MLFSVCCLPTMPTLRIKLPGDKGEISHFLSGERITVGRRPENTIQVIDRTVSAHHAEFIAVNGHYRLHDLGSTNLTCVDGHPITDFHLHEACKVSFGTVECEFFLENLTRETDNSEIVPTRAELEFLRRENLELLSKIAAMQKQVDILSSARLVTSETTQLGVAPAAHRRVSQERDELRSENLQLKVDIRNLKDDIQALTRARDAMRVAWETVKAELAAAQDEIAALGGVLPEAAANGHSFSRTAVVSAPVTTSRIATPTPVSAPATGKASAILEFPNVISPEHFNPTGTMTETRPSDDHRALATVVMGVPPLLRTITQSLAKLAADPGDASQREKLVADLTALNSHTASMAGHPVQRVAAAMHALAINAETTELGLPSIRSLQQGADLIGRLLDPAHLKRARNLEKPTALVVDDDPDLVATVTDALSRAGITASSCCDPEQALGQLSDKAFDLVLLDIGFPKANGIEMCARIREFAAHKRTPIVFLTATDSIESRAQSSLNGGNDFITKPFNTRELALKAGTWAFRNQFEVN